MIGKHDIPSGYYCGPSALMLLTGEPYEKVRAALNKAMMRRENVGIVRVYIESLISAILILNYRVVERRLPPKPTPLYKLEFKGHWIVRSSGHYMAVVDGEVAENRQVWWTPLAQSPSKNRRITHAWRLEDAA